MTSPYGQIRISPAGAAIMSFRANGHSDESAVGDIVDNSVDAGATEIKIDFTEGKTKEKSVLTISDNGCGMTAQELALALTLGPNGTRQAGDLGKFGLGMKFAAIALGRQMEVMTQVNGGDLVRAIYDIDVIQDSKTEWTAKLEKVTDKKTKAAFKKAVGDHGTIIKIQNLDMMSSCSGAEFHKRIIAQMGYTYHRLIEGSQLKLLVDGIETKSTNPLEPLFENRLEDDGFTGRRNYLCEDFVLNGKSFTLESVVFEAESKADIDGSRSWSKDAEWRKYFDIRPNQTNSGVYILRNGRLIQHRRLTDFGKASHPSHNYLRFVLSFGDELDEELQVPNSKNSIGVNEQLKDMLAQHIKARASYVNGLYNSRKVKDKDKEIEDAESEVQKAIARAERDKNLKRIKPRPTSKVKKQKTQKKKVPNTPTKGRKPYVVKSQFATPQRMRMGRLGPLFQYKYDSENRIVLILNVDHPFYSKFVGVEQSDKSSVTKLFDILLFSFIYSGEEQAMEKEEMDIIMEEHLVEMGRVTRLLADAIE